MRSKEERARLKRLTNAANKINKRLATARKNSPGSIYANELEKRIITYANNYGLVRITPEGVTLSRSYKQWETVPEYLADAIVAEIAAVGSFQNVRERAVKLLKSLDIEEPTNDEVSDLLSGAYDLEAKSHAIWEAAYEAAWSNPKLHEFFQKLFGNARPDEETRWKQTEWLMNTLLSGDDGGDPNFVGKKFGYNERKDRMEIAARMILKKRYQAGVTNQPDDMAALVAQYAGAKYGYTDEKGFHNKGYNELTPEQIREVLRKFFQ